MITFAANILKHMMNDTSHEGRENIYHPKRRGRRTNRYKHYFKARCAPRYHGFLKILMNEVGWSATPIRQVNIIFRRRGETFIKYKTRL